MREGTARRGRGLPPGRALLGVVLALAVAVLAGCTALGGGPGTGRGDSPGPASAPSTTGSAGSPAGDTTLTLGVYGPPAEIDAWRRVAERFGEADVDLLSARTPEALQQRIARTGRTPDVFLTPRDELHRLVARGVTRPVDELLDARGVDFGDGFSRDALQAFSEDDALQCMPWAISPQVVFVNTDLVDFEQLLARGRPVPDSSYRWSLEEFTWAARSASRPAAGIKGVHVPTTLAGLAPFLYAGGGQVYNASEFPTSLAFSSEESQDALAEVLPVLRNPRLTLSPEERAEKGPLARFADGQLGMLVGDHSLIPRLRAAEGLNFDVRAIPRIDARVTAGTVTGLCLAAGSPHTAVAADLLVHATRDRSVATVVREGYTVPANLRVLGSPAFTAPGRMPEHSGIFSDALRRARLGPAVAERRELARAVEPLLRRLVSIQVLDLGGLTHLIDEESRSVLDSPGEEPGEPPPDLEQESGTAAPERGAQDGGATSGGS